MKKKNITIKFKYKKKFLHTILPISNPILYFIFKMQLFAGTGCVFKAHNKVCHKKKIIQCALKILFANN